MANSYSIKLLQLHVFGQKCKLAFVAYQGVLGCRVIPVPALSGQLGAWGYTLSLGRHEALHLHFKGQDNEKEDRNIIDRPASGPSKIRFGRPHFEAQRVLAAQMGQTQTLSCTYSMYEKSALERT
jgi:hypothetical protein